MDFNFDLGTVLFLLGGLSFVIGYVTKKYPKADEYFQKGAFVLDEVDDVVDGLLEEFPDNPALNTVNDISDKLLEELKQAGYKVDAADKKKIENRIKSKAAGKDGFSLSYDPINEETKLEYNKEI